MKKICLLFFACCCLVEIYAQQKAGLATACLTPFGCSNDLRNAFYTDIQIDTLTESYAKIPIPGNYHDVLYGSGMDDCTTGSALTTCTDDPSQLKYKVFFPDSSLVDYHSCKLPAVFIIHGGGFQDCGGSYLDSGIVKICQEFAKRGIIAVSIEYRLGALAPSITQYSAQQELAIYRAAQDIRGFIRTFIKRQWSTEPTREPYQADTAKLFISGASAGSVVAMSAIFYTQDMLNQVYPGINNSNILGAVDKNFYYGETTINYNIKGFMDMWGGLTIPPNPTYLDSPELFFNQDTFPKPPTIIFHGKGDQVFIYNHKNVNFYRSGMYNSESNCLQSNPLPTC